MKLRVRRSPASPVLPAKPAEAQLLPNGRGSVRGVPPFHYHNRVSRQGSEDRGLAIYLDVSGSVNEHLLSCREFRFGTAIIGLLRSLKAELKTVFLFSNKVVEVPFKALLAGRIETTYGTDFARSCASR